MKKLLILCVASAIFASCENTEVEDPISPAGFAVATANYSGSNAVSVEDETVAIDITLSKLIDNGTTFVAEQIGGTAVEGEDFTIGSLTIPAFVQSGQLVINLLDNSEIPEAPKTLKLRVSTPEFVGALLNPSSNLPYIVDLTINVNSTEGVTVAFGWNEDQGDDLDIVVMNSSGGELRYAATAGNPEVGVLVLNSDPDDTYYVDVQPYAFSQPQIDFNFSISKPSGELTEYSGTFDTDNLGAYASDESPTLGTSYRLVKIVKSGSDYTITKLF